MTLTDFVRARAAEDELLAQTGEPPARMPAVRRLARELLRTADLQDGELTRRQRAVLLQIADLHRHHPDYDPAWYESFAAQQGPTAPE